MSDWIDDLRFGARLLARNPGSTVVAVLTLALGIGANTAVFSIVNGVLLRPLPYLEAGRLVRFTEKLRDMELNVSYSNYQDWRRRSTVFEDMATYNPFRSAILSGADQAEQLPAAMAEANLFRLLGISPVVGRLFSPQEETPQGEPVVLLSHGLWTRRFGADAGVVGSPVRLNGRSLTVIGVLPPELRLGSAQVWYPLGPALNENLISRANHGGFQVIGRLKPGMTLEEARVEMDTISRAMELEYPETNTDARVLLTPLLDSYVSSVRPVLWMLVFAVGFVLLIACANLANIMLARASGRTREMAIRTALGAGRARIARGFLSESVWLALLSGGGGLLLALWGVDALLALEPGQLPRKADIQLDGTVLAFTVALSLLSGLLFGTAPVWQYGRIRPTEVLKQTGLGSIGARSRMGLRWSLVAVQVALSLVLLVGAGLMVRTLVQLSRVDPGFDARNVAAIPLTQSAHGSNAATVAFTDRLLERAQGAPGVESAAAVWPLSLATFSWTPAVNFERDPRPDGKEPWVQAAAVTSGYFQTMGIPLRSGRLFDPGDREGSPTVAIVNDVFVRRYLPEGSPLGERVRMIGGTGALEGWATIVGVVGGTIRGTVDIGVTPEIYWPFAQFPMAGATLVVRTASGVAAPLAPLRQELAAMDPDLVVHPPRAMEEILLATVADRAFLRFILSLFAAVALLLAAVGISGVLAFSASQRTREVGIRMALGARRGSIMKLILGQSVTPVACGLGAGLAAALLLTRFLDSRLFGVQAFDPTTLASVLGILVLVAMAACYLPARRAARVDPMVALRYE